MVELEHAAFRTGALDILVTAYRSSPELLTVLLRASTQQERITALNAAHDEDLARAVGQPYSLQAIPESDCLAANARCTSCSRGV